jgi:hypothetical protein
MVQATQGYWSARVQELERQLAAEKARQLALQSDLDSLQLRVYYSEQELIRLKQLQYLKETELAMELEKVRAQVLFQRE